MLSRTTMRSSGFTLIEMMVTLAVLALLFAVGLPSMSTWLQNVQIRSAAESMQAGLQSARAEALRRNDLVRFQLVDSLASGCALTASGTSFVVNLGKDDATGKCDAPESDVDDPKILQKRSGAEGSPNAVINASSQSVLFNGLGRISAGGAQMLIDVTNAAGGKCQPDGPMRCLRLTVAPGGGVRMCDPAVTDATDPRHC
jgi:type IV fimbrial biogenesis protein FimT